jgi:hypothetical protein
VRVVVAHRRLQTRRATYCNNPDEGGPRESNFTFFVIMPTRLFTSLTVSGRNRPDFGDAARVEQNQPGPQTVKSEINLTLCSTRRQVSYESRERWPAPGALR